MSYPKLTPIITKGATEPRYLGDRFADVANVKDFGAKGDGVTDDGDSFVATCRYAANQQKVVLIPAGTYLINRNIHVPSGVLSCGEVTLISNAANNVSEMPSVDIRFEGKSFISGITFKGLNVFVTSHVLDKMQSTVERCVFKNSLLTIGANDLITRGYVVRQCSFIWGAEDEYGQQGYPDDSRLFNALTLVNANCVDIEKNSFQKYATSILVRPTRSFASRNIKIYGNESIGHKQAVKLYGTSMFRISGCVIENNTFASSRRDKREENESVAVVYSDIFAEYCHSLTIKNNVISESLSNAIIVGASMKVDIVGNVISNGSQHRAIMMGGVYDANIGYNVSNISGVFLWVASSSSISLLQYTQYTKNKNIRVHDNTISCLGKAIVFQSTNYFDVWNNNILMHCYAFCIDVSDGSEFVRPEPNAEAVYVPNSCTNNHGCVWGNRISGPSGALALNDPASIVATSKATETNFVDTAAPVIVDTGLVGVLQPFGKKMYHAEFTLNDYTQLRQAGGILEDGNAVEKSLTTWVNEEITNGHDILMAWNSAASFTVNTTANPVQEIGNGNNAVNGMNHDYPSIERWWGSMCMLAIDKHRKLTCRMFNSVNDLNAYYSSGDLDIAAGVAAEDIWQTVTWRPPLVVDGRDYVDVFFNSVQGGVAGDNADHDNYNYLYATRTARMCIGQKQDGVFVVMCVDGFSGSQGNNGEGATVRECSNIMLSLGCNNAFMLDGGGSATLWRKDWTSTTVEAQNLHQNGEPVGENIVNIPMINGLGQSRGERKLVNIMYIQASEVPPAATSEEDTSETSEETPAETSTAGEG